MTDPLGVPPVGTESTGPLPGAPISVTESQILAALRMFLLSILPGEVEIIRGQANYVPEPTAPDYVVMTHVYRKRLSTNVVTWGDANPVALDHAHATMSDIQLDVHGPNSTDNAQIITTLWRDDYACQEIDSAVFQPLYASDGRQMPFINGEQQYEDRWVVTVTLEATPIISTSAQFAATLSANISAIGSANP